MKKTYEIAGRMFVQGPLVLGQVQQLLILLKDTAVPGSLHPVAVMAALGAQLSELLAVVLVEKDRSAKDKDVAELAGFLADNLPADTAAEMVTDFFELNGTFFSRMKGPGPDTRPGAPETKSPTP